MALADDGKVFHAPYGFRLRHWGVRSEDKFCEENLHAAQGYDQVADAVKIFDNNPNTRQVVLSIWNPDLDLGTKTKDIPCNDILMLKIRNGKLTGAVMMMVSVLLFLNGSMSLMICIGMTICAFMLYSSLEQAGSYSALLRTIDICIDKAQKILDLNTMDIDGKDIIPQNYDIDVNNIEFSYDKRKIIDGISLHIPQKTTTAVVGPSGGGKSTLCNLISRFWDVDGGNIRLGGIDVREYSMDSLMKNFSFVFQNVYLFADTVANNIAFGRENATRKEIVTAAKKACCHDFIMSLPDGYDTVIGEGGASISGGEKQRISIARAIMKNAPIIILDEATANVDPENEKELVEAIDALTKEKTIIMIAHRLKTVRNADQIVVVDSGKIAQLGTHTQLMQEGGIYKNFVNARQQAAGWKINA